MKQPLNTVLLPLNLMLGNKEHNLAAAEKRIESLNKEVNLVVLPELFNTGFGDFGDNLHALAENEDGETISRMKALSAQRGIAIIGGFIRHEGNQLYNSAFIINKGDLSAIYDKRHLFAGPEQKLFHRGESPSPIVDINGWKVRLAICYDLRFPVWNRSRGLDYDVLVFIANWVHARNYAWRQLLIARAIENQAYVLACNREGEDIYGKYMRGDSMIVNAMGYPIGKENPEGSVSAILDYNSLESDRHHLKPWKVADDFTINL